MPRVYETFTVLALLTVVVFGVAWVVSAIIDDDASSKQALFGRFYAQCSKIMPHKFSRFENRVLCKTFSSRQNSEVQPSVTEHKDLKMYLNDIITNISHQFCINSVNTIIYMQQNMKPFWLCL